MRTYTDKQLLDKVKSLGSFKEIPSGYWILGVQSNEDTYDKFDDKFYLFKGEQFIMATSGTTNAGSVGLMNFAKYNKQGVAVLKTDEWYYGVWSYGLHQGKMKALKQIKPFTVYRDADKDKKAEQLGNHTDSIVGINFHTVSYTKTSNYIAKNIGGWSVGCQVCNNVTDYYRILEFAKNQSTVSYCLLKEF
jgi:hypothetical protein